MTRALRSPGSTLKPFIYGLAIEDGQVVPETIISDRPAYFGGYRPTNFDTTFQGDVSIRQALQASLNVPAVKLLEAVTPLRLVGRFKRAGVALTTKGGEQPGLSLALGGASLSLTDLVQLYANLISRDNRPILLGDGIHQQPGFGHGSRLLSGVACWHVTDMLRGVREPVGSRPLDIAYKTGTSYGHRDAWSVGYDGRHVIGVWAGRADNGPVPGVSGIKTAAPVLFEAFAKLETMHTAFAKAPAGAIRRSRDALPPTLKTFQPVTTQKRFAGIPARDRLRISFPSDESTLEIGRDSDGNLLPVVVKLQGGIAPFRLMEEQVPGAVSRRRQMLWEPGGKGFYRMSIVDSVGQVETIRIRVE